MKKHRITAFTKGWFIGDFTPTLLATNEFEAAMKTYNKGETEAAHVHEIAREFTIIGTGRYRMNDVILEAGDIMELAPGDVSDFECLESGVTFVVKYPSARNDKKIVQR